jgi:hypothetical protein
LDKLDDWSEPILQLQRWHNNAGISDIADIAAATGLFTSSMPRNLNPEQSMLKQSLLTLLRAGAHMNDAKYNQSLVNLELMAFALCWFGMVS